MFKFIFIIFIFLQKCQATGRLNETWENEFQDQLKTYGWEWHDVKENFFTNQLLTKNVFDFFLTKQTSIILKKEVVMKNLNLLDKPIMKGFSFSIFIDSKKQKNITCKIKETEIIEYELKLNEWQEIFLEQNYGHDASLESFLNFEINFEINDYDEPVYIAISKLTRYFKFDLSNKYLHFNFTRNTNDYLVKIDNKQLKSLTDYSYWTNLNFPDVVENKYKSIAVSKLNNNYMELVLNFNSLTPEHEKYSLCVLYDYFYDNEEDLIFLEIFTKPKTEIKNLDQKLFKYADFISNKLTSNENSLILKKWIKLKNCFHFNFIKKNFIYLVSNINLNTQLGQFPRLTNGIANIKLERKTELFNDFLHSWSTGLFDPSEEWYTTPILNNFNFQKDLETNQTFIELINQPDSIINVYYLISNGFVLSSDMKLNFILNNNHSDGSIKIYIVEDNEKRKLIDQINLSQEQEDDRFFSLKIPNNFIDENSNTDTEKKIGRLIFEFKLKRLEINDTIEKLSIHNLNLMDPCDSKFGQCVYGKCVSEYINKWKCSCEKNAHGTYCEYLNMCKKDFNKFYISKNHFDLVETQKIAISKNLKINGDSYCLSKEADSCNPIDNRIICNCKKNFYWNINSQTCVEMNSCAFFYCPENTECVVDEKTSSPECKCKDNYYFNENGECILDYCKKKKCLQSQICVNDMINKKATCLCNFGFTLNKKENECRQQILVEDECPFIAQFYGCKHKYKFNEKEKSFECDCYDGYDLAEDKKTCIENFDLKLCGKTEINEICVKPEKSTSTDIILRLGYSKKDDVVTNFCDNDKEKISYICNSENSCSASFIRRTVPFFQCSCNPEIAVVNDKKGVCEIKNLCNDIEQNKCDELNAFCVPKLIVGELKPVCECSIGFIKNKEGYCVPIDEVLDCQKFNTKKKYNNVKENKAICACLPGYRFDKNKKTCVLSFKNVLQINATIFLKSSDLDDKKVNDEIPESFYSDLTYKPEKLKIFDCSHGSGFDREHCFSVINSNYLNLMKQKPDLMNIEFNLYKNIRALFFHILDYDENIENISLMSYENVTEIQKEEFGFKTKYFVSITLISDLITEEKLKDSFDVFCKKPKVNNLPADIMTFRADDFEDYCFVGEKLPLIHKKIITQSSLNLCETKSIQCPVYSTCVRKYTSNMNEYSCLCDKGFKSLHKIEENNLNIEVCEDIDECISEDKKNDCEENTTVCENLIGTYKCTCKENFKRLNETHCEEICLSSFPCKNGKCQVFEKNFEICVCEDGYKGLDCSKEDSLVMLLKEILIFVTVGLGLLLIVVIAVSIFCIKSSTRKHRNNIDEISLNNIKKN